VDELKAYCGEHGLAKAGNKAVLVKKIAEHLGV
jgi:hypothetical protein